MLFVDSSHHLVASKLARCHFIRAFVRARCYDSSRRILGWPLTGTNYKPCQDGNGPSPCMSDEVLVVFLSGVSDAMIVPLVCTYSLRQQGSHAVTLEIDNRSKFARAWSRSADDEKSYSIGNEANLPFKISRCGRLL